SDISSQLYLLLKVANINSDKNGKVYVPLIPGYSIYTHLGEYYFFICLEWCEICKNILYRWTDFGTNDSFQEPVASNCLPDSLTSLRNYIKNDKTINYKGEVSITYLMGLTCTENVQWLRGFINNKYPDIFLN
ncbi:19786_t:CDS:1, partial [Dentiscutata erythropus]